MTTSAAVVVTALTLGLASASASPAPPPAPKPPAGNVADPAVLSSAHLTPALFTPSKIETVFDPVTPCRIVDTRIAGGPMSKSATRSFFVGGTTAFVTQGGKSGGCGIPLNATSIAAVITAVTPSHPGYLKAYPSDVPPPNSSVVNYPATTTTGSGVTLAVNAKTTGRSLTIYNFGGPTQLIIDVTGYYAPQMEGMVAPDGSIYAGSARLLSAVHNSTGEYTVTWDTDVRFCTPTINVYPYTSTYQYGVAYDFDVDSTVVRLWTISKTTHLEVPTDNYFYLTVNC